MRRLNYLNILLLVIMTIACSDDVTVLSALKDGEELKDGEALEFTLQQNSPNPFNSTTDIRFAVTRKMSLVMSVYTEDWVRVSTLIDGVLSAGVHVVAFDAKNNDGKELPSGEYYYTLEGNGVTLTRKMLLIK